eukprot:GHVR01183601.1.p1 GENE.GHVR01183601.1~~GHVR01183601.1.p1  ORF type:complete len:184 (-),score=23.57 GHVR01183601.1:464-1015(-)
MNDDEIMAQAVNNVSPKMVDGGRQLRGPNATYDFIQQVWIEKALIQTRMLPHLLEKERQNYCKQLKLLEDIGNKGKYTDSYGWSQGREVKFEFSLSPHVYNYFANVVGPFLGYEKDIWHDKHSKMWKRLKKMIVDGDKIEMAKLQREIERQLLDHSSKKIQGAISGIKDQGSSTEETTPKDNI